MKLFGNSSGGRHGTSNINKKCNNTAASREKERVFDADTVQIPRDVVKKAKSTKTPAVVENKPVESAGSGKRKALIVLCVVAALILAVIVWYSLWEKPPEISDDRINVAATPEISSPPNNTGDNQTPVTDNDTEPEETVNTPEPVVSIRKEECYTFLIAASDVAGSNTDALMVGRFDVKNGTLSVVNIPRDTLVNVSWGVKKINTILSAVNNDPEKLKEYVGDLLGFNIDCYAIIDINVVEKIVDCIGGVYYTVPVPMDYEDPYQGLSIHIEPGYQLLDGENAVKVLRFRSGYSNGDLGRVQTQQDFMMALASQMLSLGNIPNLPEILNIIEKHVQTDLSANNIAYFAREFLTMDKSNISFVTAPGESLYIRGGSYYQVSADEWLTVVNERLNPYMDDITVANVDILNVSANGEVYSTTGEHIPLYEFYDYFNQ